MLVRGQWRYKRLILVPWTFPKNSDQHDYEFQQQPSAPKHEFEDWRTCHAPSWKRSIDLNTKYGLWLVELAKHDFPYV